MFSFLTAYFKRQEGSAKYGDLVFKAIADGVIDKEEGDKLKVIATDYGLRPEDLKTINNRAFFLFYEKVIADGKINEDEEKKLNDLISILNISKGELGIDTERYEKAKTLNSISQGKLPVCDINELGMVTKDDEIFHFVKVSALMKRKNVTQRVKYSGLTVSIRIAKGVSYKIGDIGVQTINKEVMTQEDIGFFWISNGRIGYKGAKKHFSIPLTKIISCELQDGVLSIMKEGRESSYLVVLTDYESPLAIISHLLNHEDDGKKSIAS